MSLHCCLLLLFLCRYSLSIGHSPIMHAVDCKPSPETPAEVGLHTITVWYSCMGPLYGYHICIIRGFCQFCIIWVLYGYLKTDKLITIGAYTVKMAITVKANFPNG
ncbi:hypothetical protein EDD85DRAFT_798681 [Armillaria nabsnona]|nr:hypothetical protein EDD85DRAFT_798681 [Armillaria nabsnona]